MSRRRGLTLVEFVLTLVVVAVVGTILLVVLVRRARIARAYSQSIRCRNYLNGLAKGMATYLNEYGDNRWYPCPLGRGTRPGDYNGAEWLASLYWSGVVPDPGVFVCPASPDRNALGRDLGTHRAVPGRFGSQTVSYAAMHYYSLTDADGLPTPGAIRDDFPPNMPVASDDTEGTINHGKADKGGMCVLFFDSHVEFRTNAELNLETSVGDRSGGPHHYAEKSILWQLRN